ncbi:tRNA (adenosine(37)-N6)-dimethylallyltransferase MiaA [Patescibacteria group bacterium]|nr:tRNA (adenosine(37)-N6)-dimethylallyltransferase MiaA [Patescibacteria group bacterium]
MQKKYPQRLHPDRRKKIIVVLGPTASGKTDLAVGLARQFNGEIISADSRQAYRGMNIGTGKITKKEMAGIPHYLLDIASPKRRFTVAQYQKLAQSAIKKILAKGKIPIICGGTGFYIQAITENLQIPEVKPDLKLRAKLEKIATKELYKKLQKLDPKRAKEIDPFNRRRLIRALEIVLKTGKPVPALVIPARFAVALARRAKAGIQNSEPRFRVPPPLKLWRAGKPGMTKEYNILFLGVKKSPAELKKLIHKRLLKRLKQRMIKEVQNLRASGLSWKRLDSFGLEYRWVARFLQKRVGYEEMISQLQKDIEHFAKRQMTWFKRDKRIFWINNKRRAYVLAKNFLQH